MITDLRIRDLGVIDAADIEFGTGFTCLTGETGAGKTMVLTAVSLLKGEKCPPTLVRAESARVDVTLTATEGVVGIVEDSGGSIDDGHLLIGRTIPADGRSRAFLGGVPVPLARAGQVVEQLITVHGQSDQLRLRSHSRQRDLLDHFAGEQVGAVRERYRASREEWLEACARLAQARERSHSDEEHIKGLVEALAGFDEVSPVAGEDEQLAAEASRLGNVAELLVACQSARQSLVGDEVDGGARDRLDAAQRCLERVGSHDPALERMAQELAGLSAQLSEAVADVATYATTLEADPRRLDWVQQRLADIAKVTRLHGGTIESALEWAERSRAEVAQWGGGDQLEQLEAAQIRAEQDTAAAAAELTKVRELAAVQISQQVTEEMRALGMPDARLEVVVRQSESPDGIRLGPRRLAHHASGVDDVVFLFAAHAGARSEELSVAASGGELSRVMLALEVVLSSGGAAPTMIFDEVDAGVGGKAAAEIGRRLARLGRQTQVIVVTHLPQVAAFADAHLRVRKQTRGGLTTASVEPVEGEQRTRELARMLAGQEESDHALAHAEELLDLAALERRSGGADKPRRGRRRSSTSL